MLAIAWLAGCGSGPAPSGAAEVPAANETTTPTVEQLRNLTYYDIVPEPVALEDGHWIGSPFVEGSDDRPVVQFVDDSARFGDMNGDGVDDAAVLLKVESGVAGAGTYVAVVGAPLGQPSNYGSAFVGKRSEVESIEVTGNGWIHLKLLEGAERWTKEWALVDGKLKQVSALVEQ